MEREDRENVLQIQTYIQNAVWQLRDAAHKAQITTLTHQSSLLADELAQAQQVALDRSRTIAELQDQLSDFTSATTNTMHSSSDSDLDEGGEKEMELSTMNTDMNAVVRDELHRQTSYLRTLESANARLSADVLVLREREESVAVLKEERRALEAKVRVVDELRDKVVRLEAELEVARTRDREPRSVIPLSPSPSPSHPPKSTTTTSTATPTPTSTPISTTKTLTSLRLAHAQLLEAHGSTAAILRQRESESEALAHAERQAQNAVVRLEAEVQELRDRVTRREQRVGLIEREVGFLRALLVRFILVYFCLRG